ncbi:MAG: CCA tRNA nucleotidyltransferase, partial [Chloroflexota bacterium]
MNLGHLMRQRFSEEVSGLLSAAGTEAWGCGERLYLVGGTVRDLLLGRTTLDLDMVVEGDAMVLAETLAARVGGRLTIHRRFGTAKWKWGDVVIDLATSRSESYARPGALPTVRSGSIGEDLGRRDFTVNALAAHLSPDRFGELIDPCGGLSDLEQGLIRVLHDGSFIDDATRILRAVRYEQRLDFRLEPKTENLVRKDVRLLDTISGDRLRHELELVFREEEPWRILLRAQDLGVLKQLHPALEADSWLKEKFALTRCTAASGRPLTYLLLLGYRLTSSEVDEFTARFGFEASRARSLKDVVDLRDKLPALLESTVKNSGLYRLLAGYSLHAIAV